MRLERLRLVFFPLLLSILVCVACTPYYGGETGYEKAQPEWGTKFGYREKKISEDEFAVIATGNPETSTQRVADIALLRAAQITLEQGGHRFVVLEAQVYVLRSDETVSAPLGGLLVWVPIGRSPTQEPQATLLFRIIRDPNQPINDSLDPNDIVEQLSKKFETSKDM